MPRGEDNSVAMDAYLTANQALWNSWTPFHVTSRFYDVAGFKAGKETLDPIALTGLGDVRGKSLLHLQCHFGLDTLSWARHGVTVTGADFSEEAIKAARTLAQEIGIAATFVHSNLYNLPQHLAGQFDRLFTSHGVLSWLPDLDGWARVIAHFLTRFHSLADILGALRRAGLRITSFDEYPFMGWAYFPWMERRADGWWHLPPGTGDIPLMFSLRASKEVG